MIIDAAMGWNADPTFDYGPVVVIGTQTLRLGRDAAKILERYISVALERRSTLPFERSDLLEWPNTWREHDLLLRRLELYDPHWRVPR